MAVSSMWLLIVLAYSGSGFAASAKIPVRRQKDLTRSTGSPQGIDCVLSGDARPAGHRAGTASMEARLFQTPEQAQEYFHLAVSTGSDIVLHYKGCPCNQSDHLSHPYEFKHVIRTRHLKNADEWRAQNDRTFYEWCKKTDALYEDVSPDKWRPFSFIIHPPINEKAPRKPSSSMLKRLATNDEDEGPATAYSGIADNMRCVVTGKARAIDHSNVNVTLFFKKEDANQAFRESLESGADLAVHYKGKLEEQRLVSPKLKHVPWLTLLNWCQELQKEWKAQPKGAKITEDMIKIGRPSPLVAESFIRESPPPEVSPASQVMDEGSSMEESAETLNAWASADFATKTPYKQMQDLLGHGMVRQVVSYKRFPGWDCGVENFTDSRLAGADMTVAACKERCDKDLACGCIQYNRSDGVCYYTQSSHCHEKKCKPSKTTSVYLQTAQWTVDTTKVKKIEGKTCGQSGGKLLGIEKKINSDGACRELCASEKECTCFKVDRMDKSCTIMKECDLDRCEDSTHDDMYLYEAAYNGYARDHTGKQW